MANKSKNKLTKESQLFVVECLACFKTPSEIVTLVKENYLVDVTKQAIECYDPTKFAGRNLKKDLKEYFEKARNEYLNKVENIGISHSVYRLNMLQRMAEKAEQAGTLKLAADLLKQAKEETAKTQLTEGENNSLHVHITRKLSDKDLDTLERILSTTESSDA